MSVTKRVLRLLITKYLPGLVPVSDPDPQDVTGLGEAKVNALSSASAVFQPVPDWMTVEDVMVECGCSREQAEMRLSFRNGGIATFFQFDNNFSVEEYLRATPSATEEQANDAVAWAHRDLARLCNGTSYMSRYAGDPWKVMV